MSHLPLSLFVTVSVSQIPAGIEAFNVNNVILFTDETPAVALDGDFAIYSGATAVGEDWGTSSQAFAMATALFAQTPNILAGGGALIIAPLLLDLPAVVAVQHIAFSTVPTAGSYVLNHGVDDTTALAFGDNAAAVQVALRLLPGFGAITVAGDTTVGFTITFTGVTGPVTPLTVTANTLTDTDDLDVTLTVTTTTPGVADGSPETMVNAIIRLQPLVAFCGVMKTNTWVVNEILDAATYVQTQEMIMGVQSSTDSDANANTGILWLVMDAGLSQTRCTQYLNDDYDAASVMLAAYFGRGFSVDFGASNSTINMQFKTLNGINGDQEMDQTQWTKCQVAGVDTYPVIQTVSKVSTSGKNFFFDQVYNAMWLKTSIEVSVFNTLAQTPTKIPQTEQGMTSLKRSMQAVYEQAVNAGYLAPGAWVGDTFGNQPDFLRNISDVGFYIYSSPIATQLQADRALRKAPPIQSAGKEAGGINSANIFVSIQP